jgi:site-specific recombinase XerD
LKECLNGRELTPRSKLFTKKAIRKTFERAHKRTGIHITPQILREWFACTVGERNVADRYVDAFCGRVPRSVLARHYTDFSPERLRKIYEGAGLKALE